MNRNELIKRKSEIDQQIYLLLAEKNNINRQLKETRTMTNAYIVVDMRKRLSVKNTTVLLNYASTYRKHHICVFNSKGEEFAKFNPSKDDYVQFRASLKELELWK